MESKDAVKSTTPAVNAAVITTPARKSLRKDKAAAKFSGSPGLAAFAIASGANVPGAAEVAAKAISKPSKAAAKPKATPAPAAAAKAAETPVAAPVVTKPFVARLYQKGTTIYQLDDISRPVSGRLLLAHTHAALSLLGLLDAKRPAINKNQLLALVGQRAVNYHLSKGNLEAAPDHGIRLSILGFNTFQSRVSAGKVDTEAATAYQSAFLDGKPDAKVNVAKGHLFPVVFS
jgi:hypothetical protein